MQEHAPGSTSFVRKDTHIEKTLSAANVSTADSKNQSAGQPQGLSTEGHVCG